VDPFTADEALWEFENLFVLSGQTQGAWEGVSSKFATLRRMVSKMSDKLQFVVTWRRMSLTKPNDKLKFVDTERSSTAILDEARSFVSYCAQGTFAEAGAAAMREMNRGFW